VTGGTDIIKDLVEITGEVLGIGSDRSTEGHTTLTGSLECRRTVRVPGAIGPRCPFGWRWSAPVA